jgi:predicted nucleic acid-binding protein
VTIVADAGPLMALAKVGGLDALFRLFPTILTPPAVYEELITAGLRLGAPDAALLLSRYQAGDLKVLSPVAVALPISGLLGAGEEQSILLAIEQRATWLLMDDLDARRGALASLAAAGSEAQLKGTLGVILAAYEQGHLAREQAAGLAESIRDRPDICISADLCNRVLGLLGRR